jgi:hypothetical protein
MTKQRTEVFSTSFDDLKPEDWQTPAKPKAPRRTVQKEEIQKVATGAGFHSRQPAMPAATAEEPPQQQGRVGRAYRTGRSDQLALKVRTEDKTAFYKICDNNGWVQGYGFQRALEALERELQAAAAALPKAVNSGP